MRRLAFLLAILAAACDSSVAPKNPYDPATPPEYQAKAGLRGRLATGLVSSLAGQQVGLRLNGQPLSPTTCAADGSFVFSGLTPGQYQVVTAPTGFAPMSLSAALKAGQVLDMGDIDLTALTGAQGSQITGRITLEGTPVDLSGSLVEAVGAAFTAVTDTAGAFRLTLIPGSYSLQFSHPSFRTFRLDGVVVGTGETRALPDDVLLYINPAHLIGHVDGEVLNGPAAPLSITSVSVDGHTGVAITGPSGDFQLDVPAGSYVMRLHKDGYADATMPVLNLVGGEDRPVGDFTLALARGGISGRVALADGGDPAGAVVEVTGEGKATVAAADGRFTIDGLVVGVHEVTARRDGYSRAVRGSITVTEGALADAGTLTLARQGGAVTVVEAPYTTARLVHLQLSASGVTHYRASEDPDFIDPAMGDVAATWHPFTTGDQVAFTLPDRDGAHLAYVAFSSGGVSPSAPVSATVVLDRLAPSTPAVVVGDGSGWSRAASGVVSLALTAQDLPALAGAEASGLGTVQLVNGTDFSGPGVSTVAFNTSVAWSLAAPGTDGLKTISVRVVDRAGNASTATTTTVTVDTAAPSNPGLTLAGPDPTHPGYTTTPFVTAHVTASDASGGTGNQNLYVKLSNDQGFLGARYQPFAPELPWVLTSVDGAKKVYARFMDPAGNESLPVEASITLTTSGPTSPALTIVERDSRQNGATNQRAVNLRLDAVGQAVLARVAENPALTGATDISLAGVTLPYLTPDALGLLLADADGSHTLWVRYYDAAGNASEVAAATVTLDRVAPTAVVPVVTPSPWAPSAAVTLTAPAAGQDEVQVSGAGVTSPSGWRPAPAGALVPLGLSAGDGTKVFSVSYRDLADNVTTLAAPAVALAVDATAPTSALTFPVSGRLADGTTSTSLTATPSVTLDLSSAGDGAGSGVVEMQVGESASLAGAAWTAWSSAPAFQLSSGDGAKVVYARFRDAVGNPSAIVSGTITLDTAGPTSATVSLRENDSRPTNGYTNATSIQVVLNAAGGATRALISENPSFAGAVQVNLVGQSLPYTTALGVFSLTPVDAAHTVWVKYFDAAGNASNPATAQVLLDRVAPSATPPALSPAAFARTTAASLTPPAAGQDELQVTGSGVANIAWSAAPAGVAIPLTLVAGDGAKAFTVTWRDLADNLSAAIPLSLTLDAAAPAIPASIAVTGTLGDGTTSTAYAASTGVTLDLRTGVADATSGVAEMMLSNRADFSDAGWQPYVASVQVPWTLLPGDGTKLVYAKFRDAAGNASAAVSGTIDLRATPPSGGTIVIAGGATDTNLAAPVAALSASGATQLLIAVNGTTITAGAGGWVGYTTSATLSFTVPGPQLVTVRFRNAARVEGGGASATITFDQAAPAAADVRLLGSRGDGLVEGTGTWTAINPVSVTIPGTAGAVIEADVNAMKVYQSSSASACVEPATTTWQPYVNTSTLLLTGVDGAKRVCAQLRDRAGNVGPAGSKNISLDTTPPTNPSFSDLSTITSNAASVTGHLVIGSTDPAPGSAAATYQCYVSPAAPQWTDCTPGAGLAFTFTLTRNAPNVVGVRARDDAWNASAGTLVSVLQDSVAPMPANITDVTTTRDSLTMTWDASPDTDVVTYRVYYGNFAGDFAGTGAAQGPSPVTIPASGQASQGFTLTGLTPSYPYYVAVEAVDRAGNVSGPSGQRFAQPNDVNPRLLSTYGGQPRSVGVRTYLTKTFAYVAQNQGVVQLDVTTENQVPVVTGRASLPNFVPDTSAPVAVFDCTRTSKLGATLTGHCVVPAGSTLEGEYRGDGDAYRAPAPVVFFPVNPPGAGTIMSVLPARPHRVVMATVAGKPVLLTVERKAVKAFDMTRVGAPRLLASSAVDLQTVSVAGQAWGVTGQALLVYAPVRTGTLPNYPPTLYEFGLANVWSGSFDARDHGWLQDPAGNLMGWAVTPIVPIIGDDQLYIAWKDAGGSWLGEWSPGTARPWEVNNLAGPGLYDNQPVTGVAGNMHVYVFNDPVPAMSDPAPYGYQVYSDGGLTRTGEIWDPLWEAQSAALAVYTATGTTDDEHLFAVDRDPGTGAFTVERWHVNSLTNAITYNASAFREVDPTWFAESDKLLFVAQGDKIFTIDTANPLFPKVTQTFSEPSNFWKLQVHGRYLYAATTGGTRGAGVTILRIDGNGALTFVGHALVAMGYTLSDFVVRGKYLYLAFGFIRAVDVGNPAAPATVFTTAASTGCSMLDVRPGTVGGLTYEGEIFCAIRGDYVTADRFQTFTFSGATIASASALVTLPFDVGYSHPTNVKVRGTQAVVTNRQGGALVNVANPASPAVSSTVLSTSGPVLFQGGYLVGLGADSAASGPDFFRTGDAQVGGTLLFSTCGTTSGQGSLASTSGVYYASCKKNGISLFAAPSPSGGTLLRRDDISQTWTGVGAPLGVDGAFAYLSGAEIQGDVARLWSADQAGTANGNPSAPNYVTNNRLAGGDTSLYLIPQDGHLFDFTSVNGYSTAIRALSPSEPGQVWPVRGSYLVPQVVGTPNGPWNTQPVSDGESAWASRLGYLESYDLRTPFPGGTGLKNSTYLGQQAGALALGRDRLYFGPKSGASIPVYDVSNGTPQARISVSTRSGVTAITGLAVQGPYLFVTYRANAVDPYGLMVIRLGAANRDGSGAVQVADFTSSLPLSSPTVVGDTLYAARNRGLTTWDLRPLWLDGAPPLALGGVVNPESLATEEVRFLVDGPFGYLLGGSYRTFDLRQ